MTNPETDLCYPVLTPFKFRGVVVKPPALIQMSVKEARVYQNAGVLGGEDVASLPPEPENDGTSDSLAPTETHSEAEAAPEIEAPADAALPDAADAPSEAEAAAEVEAGAPPRPAAKAAKTTSKKGVK